MLVQHRLALLRLLIERKLARLDRASLTLQ